MILGMISIQILSYYCSTVFRMVTCPVCCTSYADVASIWKQLDEMASKTQLQERYQNIKLKVHIVFFCCFAFYKDKIEMNR